MPLQSLYDQAEVVIPAFIIDDFILDSCFCILDTRCLLHLSKDH
jgi:hypothetical protein